MTKFSTVSARLDVELLTSQQKMREVRTIISNVCVRSVYELFVIVSMDFAMPVCSVCLCVWQLFLHTRWPAATTR